MPWFLHVCRISVLKTSWEEENFLPFSSNLKMSSANSFSLERLKFVVREKVKSHLVTALVSSGSSLTRNLLVWIDSNFPLLIYFAEDSKETNAIMNTDHKASTLEKQGKLKKDEEIEKELKGDKL